VNVHTNVRRQVFFAYVRTLRTSDIAKKWREQKQSIPIAAIATHWTDKKCIRSISQNTLPEKTSASTPLTKILLDIVNQCKFSLSVTGDARWMN